MLSRETQKMPLAFRHAICVSAATRDVLLRAGIPVADAKIIHTGLDVTKYLNDKRLRQNHKEGGLELLYAGRLASDKGIDTAIKAIAKLVFDKGQQNIKMSLAGSGSTEYENYLRRLVTQVGLDDNVSFLGWVEPEQMPDLLRKFDVLLVPSTWQEPFARIVLEGMLSGLVVVATPTGGTREVLMDGINGLLFAPENDEDLAQKISTLADDLDFRRRLAQAGRQTITDKFTAEKMLNEIESYLQTIDLASRQKEAS